MILPFSSNRSRTSFSSNCLYWASLTPRAMFSKSMNIASFRSPFMQRVLSSGLLSLHPLYGRRFRVPGRFIIPGEELDEATRRERRAPRAARPDTHGEVARPDLRPHAAV